MYDYRQTNSNNDVDDPNDPYGPDYIHDIDNKIIPHPVIQDFTTIKWLRNRVNPFTIERSVNRLLPKNGKPIEEKTDDPKELQSRKLKQFLVSHSKPKDNFQNIKIKPKYFFSKQTYQKVLKLKQIFLEFDADGSRKLEINEMEEMFRTNKIDVTMRDLLGLFFKDKKIPKNEDPYLDFYRFMEFALSKESDQLYRNFMREVKKKISHQKEEKRVKKEKENKFIQEVAKQNNETIKKEEESDEENFFLPMNFNLVLDYFNNKGKDRELEKKIKKTINKIEEYMKLEENKEKQDFKERVDESHYEDEMSETSRKPKNIKEEEIEEEDSDQGEIEINKVLDRFNELLKPKRASDNTTNNIKKILGEMTINSKRKSTKNRNSLNLMNQTLSKSSVISVNQKVKNVNFQQKKESINRKSEMFSTAPNNESVFTIFPDQNQNYFTDFLKKQISTENPENMTKNFYNKYKSLIVASELTKSKLNAQNRLKFSSQQFDKSEDWKGHSSRSNQHNKTQDDGENSKGAFFKTSMRFLEMNKKTNNIINLPDIKNQSKLKLYNTNIKTLNNSDRNFKSPNYSNQDSYFMKNGYSSKKFKLDLENIKNKKIMKQQPSNTLINSVFEKNPLLNVTKNFETINTSVLNTDTILNELGTNSNSTKGNSNFKIKFKFDH